MMSQIQVLPLVHLQSVQCFQRKVKGQRGFWDCWDVGQGSDRCQRFHAYWLTDGSGGQADTQTGSRRTTNKRQRRKKPEN